MTHPLHRDARLRRGLCLAVLGCAAAALPAQAGRIELHGSLAPAAQAHTSTGYALQARLEPVRPEAMVQLGSRHALSAKLSVSPLVCYGDTIFRDGFNDFWP